MSAQTLQSGRAQLWSWPNDAPALQACPFWTGSSVASRSTCCELPLLHAHTACPHAVSCSLPCVRRQQQAADDCGVEHTVLTVPPDEPAGAEPSRSEELLKTASSGPDVLKTASSARTASSGLETRSHISHQSSASELSQRPLQVQTATV